MGCETPAPGTVRGTSHSRETSKGRIGLGSLRRIGPYQQDRFLSGSMCSSDLQPQRDDLRRALAKPTTGGIPMSEFTVTRTLKAPRDRVWQVLTQPSHFE